LVVHTGCRGAAGLRHGHTQQRAVADRDLRCAAGRVYHRPGVDHRPGTRIQPDLQRPERRQDRLRQHRLGRQRRAAAHR